MFDVITDPTQNPQIFEEAYKNPSVPVPWSQAYQGYTAAVDWPSTAFFDTLYALNPDAKIILTVRDSESWFQSVSRTIHEWPGVDDTWPENVTKARKMARVIVRDGELGGVDTLHQRKQQLLDKFTSWIEHVKAIGKPENLLVLELGQQDSWEQLCQFLGKEEVPTVPWPHANKGDNFANLLLEIKAHSITRNLEIVDAAVLPSASASQKA